MNFSSRISFYLFIFTNTCNLCRCNGSIFSLNDEYDDHEEENYYQKLLRGNSATNVLPSLSSLDSSQFPLLNYTGECQSHNRPCNLCEGHCKVDADCAEGLSCFKRHSTAESILLPVPGCADNPPNLYDKDFCYNKTSIPCEDRSETFCKWVGIDKSSRCINLGEKFCRSTCNTCKSNLNDPSTTPSSSSLPTISTIPSIVPTVTSPILNFTGKCKDYNRKCQLCEGDCDSDEDCAEGLSCFIRVGYTLNEDLSIPGCSTNPSSLYAKDFCYNSSSVPCIDSCESLCQWVSDDLSSRCRLYGQKFCPKTCGFCESTSMYNNEPSTAPSTSLSNKSLMPSNSFSISPSVAPSMTLPILNYTGQCRIFGRPCQLCEGDCESDIDCEEGLECYVRDSDTPSAKYPVPGCATNPPELFAKDFCYNSTLAPCKDSCNSFCKWVGRKRKRCLEFGGLLCRNTCGFCRPRQL